MTVSYSAVLIPILHVNSLFLPFFSDQRIPPVNIIRNAHCLPPPSASKSKKKMKMGPVLVRRKIEIILGCFTSTLISSYCVTLNVVLLDVL